MLKLLRSSALSLAFATATLTSSADEVKAQTYQIDCAILLCLSGGWPASVPCARARAEFIRRISPWPIEPPLQIWRCPMGASFSVDSSTLNRNRVYDALVDKALLQSFPSDPFQSHIGHYSDAGRGSLTPQPAVFRESGGAAQRLPEGFMFQLVQQEERADIDISGSDFDFVRSIRVWDVRWYSHREDEEDGCFEFWNMNLGTYGTQGQFSWRRAHPSAAPNWVIPSRACGGWGRRRGVGVEWHDYEGRYGYEWVSY